MQLRGLDGTFEQLTIFPGDKMPGSSDTGPGATFGEVEGRQIYRYDLRRVWGREPVEVVNFLMLNPSTANARIDDPTVRRCIGFAKGWGFGGLTVTNLFAYRGTDPRNLKRTSDPVGPLNDEFIMRWARAADLVVCAWGIHGMYRNRGPEVLAMLRAAGIVPHLIGYATKGGHPPHPLYLPAYGKPSPMEPPR